MNNDQIPPEILEKMLKDRLIRREITSKNFWWFILFYFGEYITYPPAPFHHEIFKLIEDDSVEFLVLQAFRGSGKTTLINQFYPIWSILGKQKRKHILLLSQTLVQAKQHLRNIKAELENNRLLKNDLGPFEEDEEWNSYSLVIPEHNARITAASAEQSIRGLKHGAYRPDLIILDDVEDINSVKTRESRDNTYRWVTGDVIPLGDKTTRIIVIGNLLHEDSLLMRLMDDMKQEKRTGTFRIYPLLDKENNILWPGKYPTMDDIEKERLRVGNDIAWRREYLLEIVPDYDQVIRREWIQYYDVMPHKDKLAGIHVGIDLAISERSTADKTAMVIGHLYEEPNGCVIYLDPLMINERLDFPATVEKCRELRAILKKKYTPHFVIEDVGYQKALPQFLKREDMLSKGVRIGTMDKRARLNIASEWIKSGKILFPRSGCKILIDQIINFGVERYDDLADAFTILILDQVENPTFIPHIYFLGGGRNPIPPGPPDFGGRWTPLF